MPQSGRGVVRGPRKNVYFLPTGPLACPPVFCRPKKISAGFGSILPEPRVPELQEAGENWAGEAFSLHWHRNPGWEIVLQCEGESRWEAGTGSFQLKGAGFYVIGPDVKHRLARINGPRCHIFYAVIDLRRLDWDSGRAPVQWPQDLVWHGAGGLPLKLPFELLIREVVHASPHRAVALRAYLRALLVEAARLGSRGARPGSLVPVHPGAMRARELLEEELAKAWSLTELARAVGVSPNHLATVFRKEFGVPPHRYQLSRRLEHADHLLKNSELSIAAIAQAAGFCSSQHFATRYRAAFDCAPRDSRKRGGR